MLITPSILAADIFELSNWINKMLNQGVKKFHIDIIDPSFADRLGVDCRIIDKLIELNVAFDVHYMAYWNDNFIKKLSAARKIFFHQHAIKNFDLFNQINAGIAIDINEKVTIDVKEYIIMHVKPGYCGQKFDPTNLPLSKQLKSQGKYIIADGGITPLLIGDLVCYDELVLGATLEKYAISEFI